MWIGITQEFEGNFFAVNHSRRAGSVGMDVGCKPGRWIAAFCCLLIAASTSFAVDPSKHISQYAHTAWRTREGIFAGTPAAIAQTTDGYLWVGTNTGLMLFDGVRFRPWNPRPGQRLLDPRVISLVGGRDGSLWIGTGYGVDRLKDGSLTQYPQITGRIESIVEDAAGTVWLVRTQATDGKGPLCSIKDDQVQCYGPANGIPFPIATQVRSGSAGELWIAGYYQLCRWAPLSSTTYFGGTHQRKETFASIIDIATGKNGSVWTIINQSKPTVELQHFEQGKWSTRAFPAIDANQADVRSLFVDRDGLLWIGTAHFGIWRVQGDQIEHFGNVDGLSSDDVGSFYQDAEGTVWVVTSEGIDNFRDLRITSFSTREGLAAAGASSVVAARDGTVWVGNFESLDAVRGNAASPIRTGHGLPGLIVNTILCDHAGRLWVGIDAGLWVYENGHFQPIRHADGTPLGIIFAIVEDIHHSIWVRAGPNLDRIDDLKLKSEVTSPQIATAYALAANPRGGLLLGLVNGDLIEYDDGKTHAFPATLADNGRQVRDLLVDSDGSVWGSSLDGVFRFKDGERKNLTTHNGLPCDGIFALVKDAHDSLWMYSRCGLISIERSQLNAWWDYPDQSVKFDLYATADGAFPGLTPLKPQAARSPDGRLWFVNGRFLQVIDPDHLRLNNLPPPVHIEGVIADHQNYDAQDPLRLPPRIRELEIQYAALSFMSPQQVRFRYKLEGHDEQWQDPEARREAVYTDLPPGSYTFRVIAANNDGIWNQVGETFQFSIAPAWFQTKWFRASCVGGLFFITWLIYQLRMRRVTRELSARFDERLAERTRIARELHDTFLQTIQGSKLVADDALENIANPVRTRRALEQLSEWLGKASAEGRAALKSLRTSTTETNDLSAAFQRALEACRRETSMEANFSATGDARELHPVVRDEIYRIGYEAIRNACTHSAASRVEVALGYDDDLSLAVRDNGVGIDSDVAASGRSGHYGLQGMHERAERIGGRLTIASSANSGTEVKVVVPGRIVFRQPRITSIEKLKTILKRIDGN